MSRPFALLSLAILLGVSVPALASSLIASTDTLAASTTRALGGSSDQTSDLANDKIVLDARDDASSYVASAGAIRGAHLEAALRHIRTLEPTLGASDEQLARAILAL